MAFQVRRSRHSIGLLSVIIVPVLAFFAAADEPAKNKPPKSPATKLAKRVAKAEKAAKAENKDDQREAREILRDLMELTGAARGEPKKGGSAAAALSDEELLAKVGRPVKKVEKTSLDSEAIDAMVEASYASSKIVPAKLVSDEEFIRRVTLDVTGTIPTPQQVLKFVHDKSKSKRKELIDQLLASPEYGANWARYWREVIQFHNVAPNPQLVRFEAFETWLAEQLNKNAPWDEIAKSVITAEGKGTENGAVNLIAAQGAQAVELAGEVSRVFLGVQIQCAQCHDHPTDRWKRQQFHEFAAFFEGMRFRPDRTTKPPSATVAVPGGVPRYMMPDLKDPQKKTAVEPHFFLASESGSSGGAIPPGLNSRQRRTLAASFVTGQDNPWFAKSFVNRVWYVLMGASFYQPVDDLGPDRSPTAPEVVDAIASNWQKAGYDVQWLFRTLLNTKTYQRQFRPENTPSGKTPFAANCPSRLRADQIIDALELALGIDLDTPGGRRGPGAAQAGALAARRPNGPRALFAVDPSTPNEDVLGTIPQALYLMNDRQVNAAIAARNGSVLGEILSKNPDNQMALETLYLRVLARRPRRDEIETCGKYLMAVGNRREAFEDMYWALINSTEFLNRR